MAQANNPDNIYATYQQKIEEFSFDQNVAAVFSDMIKRSVPGYENIITMIGVFTQAHAQNNTNCYDLGCSLGASTLSIMSNLFDKSCPVIAVDNSPAMVERCEKNIEKTGLRGEYRVICDDIRNITMENASVIVLNFTLQFIPAEQRANLLKKIADALVPGGILVMSEKIEFAEPAKNALMIELHHAFKKAQGYSDLEISQKRTALENVLIPEEEEIHLNRLKQAGFSRCDVWFRCLNFASFYAVKWLNTTLYLRN